MVNGAIQGNSYKENYFFPCITFAGFFAFYAFLIQHLSKSSILHPDLIRFGEKALLVLQGSPARIENFGFVYPPLPIFLIGLTNGHLGMAQSLVAAFISTAIAFQIRKTTASAKQAFPLILYLILSFPILFMAIQRFDLYLYFFIVIVSARFLYQYKKEERAWDLFLSGPIFAVALFVNFSSIYLLPMFFIVICLLYRNQLRMILPVSLTFFTPFLAGLVLFASINLLFTGQAFGFLRQDFLSPVNIEVAVASKNVVKGFFYMLRHALILIPVILPYGIAFWSGRHPMLMLPLMILLSLLYAHLFTPAVYLFAVFIIYALMMTPWRELKPNTIFPVLVVSVLVSPVAAFFSTEPHERNVVHAFLGTGSVERDVEPFLDMAERLKKTEGKILLDDAQGYPLVYLMKRLDRFILPYQYEFAVALSNPEHFADYAVAVKDNRSDLIYEQFKTPVHAFQKRFENEKFILWKRIT